MIFADTAFSNQYWWVDLIRVVTLLQFGAALLFLPAALRMPIVRYNETYKPLGAFQNKPICVLGVDWLTVAVILLLISGSVRLIQFFGDPMVWERTPFLLIAGIAINAFLYMQGHGRRKVQNGK